jgi:hypothetical protein
MADVIIDGYINIWLVPTIPNIAAPVAATIAAGNAIELLLTPDGLAGFESTTNWVNNSALGSTFDTQLPGTVSYGDMSLQFKWQAGVGHAVEPARVRLPDERGRPAPDPADDSDRSQPGG